MKSEKPAMLFTLRESGTLHGARKGYYSGSSPI
jgi:hypothetical protein